MSRVVREEAEMNELGVRGAGASAGLREFDSTRHANYVEVSTYLGLLDELRSDLERAEAETWE